FRRVLFRSAPFHRRRSPRWRHSLFLEGRNSTRPPRIKAGASAPLSSRYSLLAARTGAGEQLAKHRINLARRRNAPHGEMRMATGNFTVACPGNALHRGNLRFGHDLDVGEVLANRQDL